MKERGLLETAFVTGRKYFWAGDFSTGDLGNFQPALTCVSAGDTFRVADGRDNRFPSFLA